MLTDESHITLTSPLEKKAMNHENVAAHSWLETHMNYEAYSSASLRIHFRSQALLHTDSLNIIVIHRRRWRPRYTIALRLDVSKSQ